jgi:myo-inositol 2-dehydrogenase/D-chiro-inositol 1-dehydrogenase
MKLALLGADETTLAIARRAIESGHQLLLLTEHDFAGQETESTARLRAALPQRTPQVGWETLLHERSTDAVVIARGADQELRADELRKLVQAGVPLLVAHPVVDSMLVYYELDMIRRESGYVIVPNMPWRWHPATVQMAALIESGDESPLGRVGQAGFERTLGKRDRASVAAQFARDVDLIRAVCGDVTKLSALGSPGEAAAYANLGVQMSGPGPVVVRWSVGPAENAPQGRLTLAGLRGKAILHIPADESPADPWRLERRVEGHEETEAFLKWNTPQAALDELASVIAGKPTEAAWLDAARAVELAEAIDRSLAKGRTIELHNEEFTDVGTFKGVMTSLGCGLLVAGLFAMLAVGLIEFIARKQGAMILADALRFWPYCLAGFLVLFLLLQLVLKMASPPSDSQQPGEPPGDDRA